MNDKGGGGWNSSSEHVSNSKHALGVFKNDAKKPLRYSKDSFTKELVGKRIRIKTTTNEIFEGSLREIGMFDCLVEVKTTENYDVGGRTMTRDTTKNLIFMKGQLVWLQVIS
jgi:hypothetical protein